jgi:hypothetical protein
MQRSWRIDDGVEGGCASVLCAAQVVDPCKCNAACKRLALNVALPKGRVTWYNCTVTLVSPQGEGGIQKSATFQNMVEYVAPCST